MSEINLLPWRDRIRQRRERQRIAGTVLLWVLAAAIVLGFQAVSFAVFTNIFAITEGLRPGDPQLNRLFPFVTLEVGLAVGTTLVLAGFVGSVLAVSHWGSVSFGPLDPSRTLRLVIPTATALTLGCQIVFTSFFLSVLKMARR